MLLAELPKPLLEEPQTWEAQVPQQRVPIYETIPDSGLERQLAFLRRWNEQRNILEQRYDAIKQGYFMDFREYSKPELVAQEPAPFYDDAREAAAQQTGGDIAPDNLFPPTSGMLELPSDNTQTVSPESEVTASAFPEQRDDDDDNPDNYGKHHWGGKPQSIEPFITPEETDAVEVAETATANNFYIIPSEVVTAGLYRRAETQPPAPQAGPESPIEQASVPHAASKQRLGSVALKGLLTGTRKFFKKMQSRSSVHQKAPGLYIQNSPQVY